MRGKILPVTVELIGIATISSGIGIELASKAEIGYVIISIGSLFIATGAIIWGKFMKGGG
jgi:hypothetical protein